MTIRDTYADDFDGPERKKKKKKPPPKLGMPLWLRLLIILAIGSAAIGYAWYRKFGGQ